MEFEDKAKLERELRRKFEHETDKLQDKLDAYSSSDDSTISEVSETSEDEKRPNSGGSDHKKKGRNGDDSSNSNNNGDNENGEPTEKRQPTKKSGVSDEARQKARQKQKQKSRPGPRRSERKKKELKSDGDENSTTPTHLKGAFQYLEKYGKTENHGDDNDFGIPTAERNKKYYHEFAKKGACTKPSKVNCKYMHVAKEAAYPNFSNRANMDKDMNTRRPRLNGHNNHSFRPRPSDRNTQSQRQNIIIVEKDLFKT